MFDPANAEDRAFVRAIMELASNVGKLAHQIPSALVKISEQDGRIADALNSLREPLWRLTDMVQQEDDRVRGALIIRQQKSGSKQSKKSRRVS